MAIGNRLPIASDGRRRRRFILRARRLLLASWLGLPLMAAGQRSARAQPKGDHAPDFTMTLFRPRSQGNAGTVRLSDLRGRVVVLNFWAALCPPCRIEMPEFERFHREFADRLSVLGLDVGELTGLGSHDDAKRLIDELDITYATGFSDDTNLLNAYGVIAMPTTVFIGTDGRVYEKWSGPLNHEMLVTMTNEAIDR